MSRWEMTLGQVPLWWVPFGVLVWFIGEIIAVWLIEMYKTHRAKKAEDDRA